MYLRVINTIFSATNFKQKKPAEIHRFLFLLKAYSLLSESELLDNLTITFDVFPFQIFKKRTALTD